jgi:hypothetical protein
MTMNPDASLVAALLSRIAATRGAGGRILTLTLLLSFLGAAAFAQAPSNTPANPPAGGTKPPAGTGGATAARKTFVVKLPPGGKYVVSIPEAPAAPVPVSGDQATLEAPPGLAKFTLSVVDEGTGYAARKELTAKDLPAQVTLAPSDLNRVHLVKVRVTGQHDKPVANAAVVVTDAGGKVHNFAIEPARQGEVMIADVAQGQAQVMVIPANSTATTKQVQIALPKGETVQTIPVALPEVTAVVEPAPASPPANAPAPAPANAPAAGTAAPPEGTTGRPAAPPERPAEPGAGSYLIQSIISLILLGGIGYGVYLFGKKQGWTVEGAMAKLGVQQQVATAAGPAGPAPAPTAAPPPVVADPNRCQFCGELKDPATGACACTVTPGAAAPGAPAGAVGGGFGAAGSPLSSGGPRMIAVGGTYTGEIFPLHGETTVGRDPANGIPLDRDTTVSRRHARLTPADGGYQIVDEGSSNGIYVNGARVSEALLRPGDEVSIGNTRFRFEI